MITAPTPKIFKLAPYAPLSWTLAPLRDKSLIVLLVGGSGSGKSRCAAEKIHAYLLKYAGAVGLMVRKTLKAANRSCVPTMWKVMGGVKSGIEWNKADNTFRYPNGSVLYTGGMQDEDQRESVRSIGGEGGVDFIWIEEATALVEQDFNELLARLRHTAASWRQVILTTNPGAPSHWINQRLILGGEGHVYNSVAADNPYLPESYFRTLQTLTGVQYQRLVLNRWVQAEGVVYDNFETGEDGNVTEDAEYNPDWPVVWGVDDGYALGEGKGTLSYHPRVFLLAQFTPQGGLNIFAEYGACLEVEETSLKNVIDMGYPMPEIAYVDSSAAQLKARIWGMGIQTIGATHVVTEGIKNVRRLICDGNGVRLLKVHPRCKELINEFQSYSYGDSAVSVNGERKPLKLNDHYCFVAGTMIDTWDGLKSIETIQEGDYVLTRQGYKRVVASGMTHEAAQVMTVSFNERSLTGTPDHPVYTVNRGWVNLSQLDNGDIIHVSNSIKDTSPCPRELYQKSRPLSTTESRSAAIQNQRTGLIANTLDQTVFRFEMAFKPFTVKSGNMSAALFLMDMMFTTSTMTQGTMPSKIWNASLRKSICSIMRHFSQMSVAKKCANISLRFARLLRNGMGQKRGVNGIDSTEKLYGRTVNLLHCRASNAAKNIQRFTEAIRGSVPTIARVSIGVCLGSIMRHVSAPSADLNLNATDIPSSAVATVCVQGLTVAFHNSPDSVYNLTVDAVPEYFANGVLVHNCDAARYLSTRLRYN